MPFQYANRHEWHIFKMARESLLQCLLLTSRVTRLNFFYFAREDFAVSVMVCFPILQVFTVGHHGNGFIGQTIQLWLILRFRQAVALYVGLHPKVWEKEEEEGAIHPDKMDPQGNLVVALFHEVVLADVNRDQNKLCKLDGRHVFLPPQIFLKARSCCR